MTRQQLRAQLRADAFARVNAAYGPEPRRARRNIARALARKEWRKRIAAIATGAAAMAAVAALALGALAPAARAQGSRKDDVVFNAQGRPMAGATVRVCSSSATGQPCSPLAPIYSDAALTQALANPVTTDGLGNYNFYAAPGRYEIEISGIGITTKQMPNVILPNDPSTPTFTSVSTTSGITAFSLALSGNLTVNGSAAVTGTLAAAGFQGAIKSVAANYTLAATDNWVNVTAAAAITAPHALAGQQWMVFNAGSGAVTVAPDSGTINGSASVPIAASTGAVITCNGTNCFADLAGAGGGASPGGSSGDVQTNNGGGGLAGGTQLALLGRKYPFGSGGKTQVQYVGSNSTALWNPAPSDANDGLSWGTAKATWTAACEALSNGSPSTHTCGSGTIYIADGAQANAAGAQYGIWLCGAGDPNCGTPGSQPAGWEIWNSSTTTIRTVCGGGGEKSFSRGYDICGIFGGSTADNWHPGLWLSSVSNMQFDSVAFFGANVSVILGICSDHSNPSSSVCNASDWEFNNVYTSINHTASSGPGWLIGSSNLYGHINGCSVDGNSSSATGGPTADNAQDFLFMPGAGAGSGGIYIRDCIFLDGGAKIYGGTAGGCSNINFDHIENDNAAGTEAVVWFIAQPPLAPLCGYVNDISGVADCTIGDCYSIRNDSPFPIVATNVAGKNTGPIVQFNNATDIFGDVIPQVLNQTYGTISPYRYRGQNLNTARLFAPGIAPAANLMPALPTVTAGACGTCTVTTGIADPSGGTGAIEVTDSNAGGDNIVINLSSDGGAVAGDSFIVGLWEKPKNQGTCCGASGGLGQFGLNGGGNSCVQPPAGLGRLSSGAVQFLQFTTSTGWQYYTLVCKIDAGYSTTTPHLDVGVALATPMDYAFGNAYLLHAYSDDEIAEKALSLAALAASCPAGASCDVVGQLPHVNQPQTWTANQKFAGYASALSTKSSAYTLTTGDSWVNVTGTTTITAPHLLTGQRWVVFNSGVSTVTVQADSGSINGASNITLATGTGAAVTCDGTNCFAVSGGGGGGGGGGGLFTSTVTLTASQVNNMVTTPVTVVAAPGAGMKIVPVSIHMEYVYGGSAFAPGGNFMMFGWGTETVIAGSYWGYFNGAGLLDQTQSMTGNVQPAGNVPQTVTQTSNAPLVITSNNGITGGTGSTLVVTVYYQVVTL